MVRARLYKCGMTDEQNHLPFSQRNGLIPIPPQLKLNEISEELKRLIDYYIGLEIDKVKRDGFDSYYFPESWNRVVMDLHVEFMGKYIEDYKNSPRELKKSLSHGIRRAHIGGLFDIVEFFLQHPNCSAELKADLGKAFVKARAAYRVIDGNIIAIGTYEQGKAVEAAIAQAQASAALPARKHLVNAGAALRISDWAGSVRESIHAVEAMARRLAPEASTLGPALAILERKGYLHGGLKSAFDKLYGYSSGEEGVRHSLVFQKEARVDEADALFMLGACASFVSYLLAREAQGKEL